MGSFCFQMGFGSGHPRSVDYFQSDYGSFSEVHNKDTRVEDCDINFQYYIDRAERIIRKIQSGGKKQVVKVIHSASVGTW